MSDRALDKDSVLFILSDIKSELKAIDDKWEKNLEELGASRTRVESLVDDVSHLKKVVHTGNGQPSLVLQIAQIDQKLDALAIAQKEHALRVDSELDHLQDSIDAVRQRVGVRTPKEVRVERLKLAGKVVGLVALALPGILALFGVG